MATNEVTITVKNWAKYNPRADRNNYSWFRFENRFFYDQAVFALGDRAVVLLLFILCECSVRNSATVTLRVSFISALLKKTDAEVLETMEDLFSCGIVTAESRRDDGVMTAESRHDDGRVTAERRGNEDIKIKTGQPNDGLHNVTKRDITKGVEKSETLSATADPHPLARIWNENSGRLAKVKGWNRARQKSADLRWKENPSTEYWTEIVRSIASSPFCLGTNDRSWRADFNWLLQPDVHLKVSEGRYSARRPSQAETFQTPEEFARQEAARLQAELATIRPLNTKEHSDAS